MLYYNKEDKNTYAITTMRDQAEKRNTILRAKIPQTPIATFNIHRELASEFTTHHIVDVEIGVGIADNDLKNWQGKSTERTTHPRIHTVLLLPKIFPLQDKNTPSVPLGLYYGLGAYDRTRGIPRFLEIGNDKHVLYGSGVKMTQKVPHNITLSTVLPYPLVTAIIATGHGAEWLISKNQYVQQIVERLKDMGYQPNTRIKNVYGRINTALGLLNDLGRYNVVPEAVKIYDTLLAKTQSGDVDFLKNNLANDLSALTTYLDIASGNLASALYPIVKTYPYANDRAFLRAVKELDLQDKYAILTIKDKNPVLHDIQHIERIEARADMMRLLKYILAHKVADKMVEAIGIDKKDKDLFYDLMEHMAGFIPDPRPPVTIMSLPKGWIYPKTHLWNKGQPLKLEEETSVELQTRRKTPFATITAGQDTHGREYFVVKIPPRDSVKGVPKTSSALIITESGEVAGVGTIQNSTDYPKWIKKIPSVFSIHAPILSSISREYTLLAEEIMSPSLAEYKKLSKNKHARELAQIGPQSHADLIVTSGYAITKPLADEISKRNRTAKQEISEMERAIYEYGRDIVTQKLMADIASQFTILRHAKANIPMIVHLKTIAKDPLKILDEKFRKYVQTSQRGAKDPVLLKMALLHNAITKGHYATELVQKAVSSPKWKSMALYVIGMNELLRKNQYFSKSRKDIDLITAAKKYGKSHRAYK